MTTSDQLRLAGDRTAPAIAQLAVQTGGPTFRRLVNWITASLRKHEDIDIHQWVDSLWYVVVNDNRVKGYPFKMQIGFTIDVVKDRIFWSYVDPSFEVPGFTNGGNCFCRSHRWWRLMVDQYPQALSDRKFGRDGTVHDYRERRKKEA
jgi:hypothetical protein